MASVRLTVKTIPKSSAHCLSKGEDGIADLTARIREAPEKGRANAALSALIAKSLGLPKSKVRVARGEASRMKLVEIDAEEEAVARWLGGLKRGRAPSEKAERPQELGGSHER
jgi:uncharacterized protein YggU (UPF0235/DUF167 family)